MFFRCLTRRRTRARARKTARRTLKTRTKTTRTRARIPMSLNLAADPLPPPEASERNLLPFPASLRGATAITAKRPPRIRESQVRKTRERKIITQRERGGDRHRPLLPAPNRPRGGSRQGAWQTRPRDSRVSAGREASDRSKAQPSHSESSNFVKLSSSQFQTKISDADNDDYEL